MTMVTPGLVSLAVRFKIDGVDQQVEALRAEVYNSLGVLQHTAVFGSPVGGIEITEVIASPDITYEITDLDVSDHLAWPGAFLTVAWTVLDSPAVFDPETKFYSFIPTSPLPSTSTVLTWAPTRAEPLFVGYTIYRRLPDQTAWTYVGSSDFPAFVDTAEFSSELLALTAEYEIRVLTQDNSDPTGTELAEVAMTQTLTLSKYRTDQSLCLVVGQIVDVGGRPDTDQIVNFFIHAKDAPTTLGLTTFKQAAVTVPLTAYGKFAAHLVQGTLVTCEIPSAGYTARFVVPTQPSALLADLTTIPVELLRGE